MTSAPITVHELTTWAKARLDELDAAVRALESLSVTKSDEARLQAHLALLDARKWRESFRARVRDLRRTVDRGAAQTKTDLDYAWNEFELALGRWIAATGEHVAAFEARTQAHIGAWSKLVGQHKAKVEASAKTTEAQFDAGIQLLEEMASKQHDKLQTLQQAGANSYGAWVEALKQSRTAFEEAVRITRSQFTPAA